MNVFVLTYVENGSTEILGVHSDLKTAKDAAEKVNNRPCSWRDVAFGSWTIGYEIESFELVIKENTNVTAE